MIIQKDFILPPYKRGYHLVTHIIEQELGELPVSGLVSQFIRHTSAALSVNENADPSVRIDFESFINRLVPEKDPIYTHIFEGTDDMPAHIKASLLGPGLNIPVRNGKLHMGTWQGIYLCEFRNRGGARKITATIIS